MKFEKGSKEETRRSLVRGSVAAPLLMTLRPSTAAAASAACFDRAPNTSPAATLTDTYADTLVRVPLQIYSVVVPNNNGGQQGTWLCYKKGGQYYTRNAQTQTSPDIFLPANTPINASPAPTGTPIQVDYALAYVDSSGTPQQWFPDTAPSQGNLKPLQGSCWSSLVGQAFPPNFPTRDGH